MTRRLIHEDATSRTYEVSDGGKVIGEDVEPKPTPEQVEQEEQDRRVRQVVAKARAIVADPAGSTDWTAAERKVILAVLVLRATR